MLEAFRNHKRWLMFIAMVLIIPSFVVTGIYSYNRMSQSDNAIAKVGEVAITPEMFDRAKREELERLRQQMGGQFRAGILDSEEGRKAILNQLLDKAALEQALQNKYVAVGEADAIALIKSASVFQQDGRFSPELYQRFLQSQGKSDEQLVMEIRHSLSQEVLLSGVARSQAVPDTIAKELFNILTEERQIRAKLIDVQKFLGKVTVAEDEKHAYYESHKADFESEEHVNVEYVTLSSDDFIDSVEINEEEVKAYYEQNQDRWTVPEERKASHILIAFDGDKEASKKKAEEILARLQKNPKRFADEAAAHSADPGSARQGGNLGFFKRGMMVPSFEAAAFAAEKGAVVGPVESEFGWHIIKVVDISPARVRPFADVRKAIEKEYVQMAAMRTFSEKAEEFTNVVYEQADSLAPVAEEFGLKVLTADNITREGAADPALKPLFNDHVVENLYNEECLVEKRNTSAIEIRPNQLIAARVVKYVPTAVMPFEEVAADIEKTIRLEKATALAKAEGEKELASLNDSKKPSKGFGPELWVSRRSAKGFSEEFLNHVVSVPAEKLPHFTGLTLENGSYAIAYVEKTKTVEPTAGDIQAIGRDLSAVYGEAERVGYLKALRESLGEEILRPDFITGEKKDDEY